MDIVFDRTCTIIQNGWWSSCYRKKNLFIKRFNHDDAVNIERECLVAKYCYDNNINTPRFYDLVNIDSIWYAIYEFIEILPI